MELHTDPTPTIVSLPHRTTARWPNDAGTALRSLPPSTPLSSTAAPRPLAAGSGAFYSPLPSMLELSAATRAVAAESALRPALLALQREACALTRARDATVVLFDGPDRTARTLAGPLTRDEFCDIVTRVARRGRRELYDGALVEPIASAPCRAVLALWRPAAPAGTSFEPHDIALISALVGGVAATIHRLLGPLPRP